MDWEWVIVPLAVIALLIACVRGFLEGYYATRIARNAWSKHGERVMEYLKKPDQFKK